MDKTNLFIVGAMKAGTTTITDLFAKHPDIFTPAIKEPHYFVENLPKNLYDPSRFFSIEKYFKDTFPEPLHIANIETEEQYKTLFAQGNDHLYRLDASTMYLHAPKAVENIYKYNPDARIIILKRDPLKRAFSHYKMDLGLGRTTRSFEELMLEQIEAYDKGELSWNTYLAMSFYNKPIARFKNTFKNVLVVDFDDIKNNSEVAISNIFSFLDIASIPNSTLIHKNESKALKFQQLFYFLKKIGLKDYFSKFLTSELRQKIFNIVSKSEKQEMVLSQEVKERLVATFEME